MLPVAIYHGEEAAERDGDRKERGPGGWAARAMKKLVKRVKGMCDRRESWGGRIARLTLVLEAVGLGSSGAISAQAPSVSPAATPAAMREEQPGRTTRLEPLEFWMRIWRRPRTVPVTSWTCVPSSFHKVQGGGKDADSSTACSRRRLRAGASGSPRSSTWGEHGPLHSSVELRSMYRALASAMTSPRRSHGDRVRLMPKSLEREGHALEGIPEGQGWCWW